jgi:hypothetical protein
MYWFTFTPPHLVRPASHPFSGKNFGAVCSGVVGVLLDELLPPPVPLASLVLGCARPMAGMSLIRPVNYLSRASAIHIIA